MFRAIGIGFSRSLPAAAALNWILKDGLGRLSRCIYTASLASAFDTNLKVSLLLLLWNGISLIEVVAVRVYIGILVFETKVLWILSAYALE